MEKKRIVWIDIMKYVCIMLVMLSHWESSSRILRYIYTPVFLTGFLFASGYTYVNKGSFKDFFIKKIRGLFVPWLIFSLFNIFLARIISFKEHNPLLEDIKLNFMQIRGNGDGMWFVAALFVAYIPFYFVVRSYEKNKEKSNSEWILLLILFVSSCVFDVYKQYTNPDIFPWKSIYLPWHLEYVCYAMLWMVAGYLFKDSLENTFNEKNKSIYWLSALALYCIFVFVGAHYKGMPFPAVKAVSYFNSFCGIYLLITLCKAIKGNKYMLYIGQNTILCFAFHGKILSFLDTVFAKLFGNIYNSILANNATKIAFQITLTFMVSFILIIPIYIVNRFFPFTVGRKYKKG